MTVTILNCDIPIVFLNSLCCIIIFSQSTTTYIASTSGYTYQNKPEVWWPNPGIQSPPPSPCLLPPPPPMGPPCSHRPCLKFPYILKHMRDREPLPLYASTVTRSLLLLSPMEYAAPSLDRVDIGRQDRTVPRPILNIDPPPWSTTLLF